MKKGLKVSVLHFESRSGAKEEHDYVVEQVIEALTAGGNRVAPLAVSYDLRELIDKLETQAPDIVFNLCETFAGRDSFEMNVTAVLEMLGVRFTGTGPAGMALRQDKALAKKLLRYHNIATPGFAVLDRNNIEFEGRLRFPLFVKPLKGDASLCIDDFSFCADYARLTDRVAAIHEQLNEAALVEEYIEGREYYAATLGNSPPVVLPLIEMDFKNLPDGLPRIYGWQAKFDAASVQYDATTALVAKDISAELRSRIIKAARDAVAALQVTDYARVDIRVTPEGIPYVLEVNANPYLEQTSEVAMAAKEAGMDYPTLINRILELAWTRCESASSRRMKRPSRAAIRARAKNAAATCSGVTEDADGKRGKKGNAGRK